jgi:hypothetical protein
LYLKRNRTPERAVHQHLLHNNINIIDVNNNNHNKKKMPGLPTTMISSLLLSLGVICVLLVSSSAALSPMTIKPPNLVLATNSCEICEVGT